MAAMPLNPYQKIDTQHRPPTVSAKTRNLQQTIANRWNRPQKIDIQRLKTVCARTQLRQTAPRPSNLIADVDDTDQPSPKHQIL
jgi:hypothetical protein